jgi:hypothetical protein
MDQVKYAEVGERAPGVRVEPDADDREAAEAAARRPGAGGHDGCRRIRRRRVGPAQRGIAPRAWRLGFVSVRAGDLRRIAVLRDGPVGCRSVANGGGEVCLGVEQRVVPQRGIAALELGGEPGEVGAHGAVGNPRSPCVHRITSLHRALRRFD